MTTRIPSRAGSSDGARRERWRVLAILLAGGALFAWGRAGLPPGHFSNADIAGMTYNADLLAEGELPYIASIEGKAPGTFFLVALVFRVFGRSLLALWWAFFAWQLLGALAVWVGARHLYGRGATLSCAGATALYLASAGQFDLNYSAWMTTAYAWAFAAAIAGLHTGGRRWHVLAGLAAVAAFLLKRQAAVLVPLFPILFLWARRRGLRGATRATWAWWILGASIGPGPLLVFYAAQGYLQKLLTSIVPLEALAGYAAMDPPLSWLELSTRVVGQCFATFPLAASLCVASVVVALSDRSRSGVSAPVAPQLVLVLLSVLAGTLGGPRYYTHYLIQYLPGLALLAARPGLLAYLRSREAASFPQVVVRAALVALVLFSIGLHTFEHATDRAARRDAVDLGDARRAGEYIAQRTTEDDTIMVWGWTAWPTYFWADRRAPVMGYKSLGLLTDPNTNSAFFPSKPIHFRRGVHADSLMKAFAERPPAYFVYGSYFTTHLYLNNEPLFEWTEFMEMMKRDYVLERTFGQLHVFAHRSR